MRKEFLASRAYHVPVGGFTYGVRISGGGSLVFVSGLTARDERGEISPLGDPAGQTRRILRSLEGLLGEVGGTLDDVVRTVTYLVDMQHHPEVHAVRREFFGDRPPASTTVQISRLFDERQLVEIEATAVLSGQSQ